MIAMILGPIYLVLGLSLLLYPKPWQSVIKKYQKDHLSLLPLMAMNGVLGLIVVNMYNVWEWNLWLLVTISGWAMLLKFVVYFILPGSVIKDALKWGQNNQGLLLLEAVIVAVAGAALTYYTYMV